MLIFLISDDFSNIIFQGTLLYTLKNTSAELDDYELNAYFSQYGEVKAIRVPHFKKTAANIPSHFERYFFHVSFFFTVEITKMLNIFFPFRNQQRLVEFYDSRACVDAYDATVDNEYKGGKWDVAFFWDHPYK